MQTPRSRWFRRVLWNPLMQHLILMCILSPPHSWFNLSKSPFRVKNGLTWFTQVYIRLPPDAIHTLSHAVSAPFSSPWNCQSKLTKSFLAPAALLMANYIRFACCDNKLCPNLVQTKTHGLHGERFHVNACKLGCAQRVCNRLCQIGLYHVFTSPPEGLGPTCQV